jgi:hypothetical protein
MQTIMEYLALLSSFILKLIQIIVVIFVIKFNLQSMSLDYYFSLKTIIIINS